jgi:hypothetical protein
MTGEVECQACHKPVRSGAARARRIGSRCWRKLRPDQRAALRRLLTITRTPSPAVVAAALSRPTPAGVGQLPLEQEQQISEQ